MKRRKLVVGNWKMNGLLAQLGEVEAIGRLAAAHPAVEVGLCVPATLLTPASNCAGAAFVGAQDCHAKASGAHTGCLSAAMVREAGASRVIVGHSERRLDQHETSTEIADKAVAARAEGLQVILCLGESLEKRESGEAVAFVLHQLEASLPEGASADWLAIAYEPIWAIGTGHVPTEAQIEEMHSAIRKKLRALIGTDAADAMRLLYGGSVNAANAAAIFALADVDGGLVGGASLRAESFGPIVAAADA
jgi:triosephosphate isomerase